MTIRELLFLGMPAAFLVTGCAEAPFIPVGQDSYTVTQTSAGGMFRSMSSLRSEVILRANEFAASKGGIAEVVSETESPGYPGKMPSFTYTFRITPRGQSAGLADSTDIKKAPADKYDRLTKLHELKVKGIITQGEFDTEKAKLLAGQ